MPVTAAFTNQAKLDMMQGVHAAADVYKVALFTQAAATLDKTSTTYSTTGELPTANGYTQGGKTLAGYAAALSGDVAYIDWTDPVWNAATFTADCAVIYNSSKSNKILAVLTFASASSTNGDWTLQLPAVGATAILRVA